jgi:hypothetical protein
VVPTPNPGRELGERLAFPQVSQDQQGLLAGVQLPPARTDRLAVAADDPGREGEGLARQRQRGTVEKQLESLVLGVDFGRLPQLPGALPCPGETRRIVTRPRRTSYKQDEISSLNVTIPSAPG